MGKMNVEKYVDYKDSGAEWLGKIPNNWDSIKMKHLFQDVSIKKKGNAELLSVTQDQGVVPRTWVENRMVMPSGALESFKFINKGDFAISLRSFEGGLEYCHHDGIISPAYTVLKAKRTFESKFYKYLFKSFSFVSELQTSVVGIRQGKNISFEELSYSYLPIPPLSEQTAIAAFLDHKTALIDQAIGIKQKQIELLKERRQILIHKAVTRGLNPNVKMKDSGVEWIGEIPEGWDEAHLKWISKIYAGGTPDKSNLKYWDNGTIPWVASGEVNQEILTYPTTYITQAGFRNSSARWIKKDSLIVALAGQGKTKGMVAYLNIDTTGNQSLAAIVPMKERIYPKYLFYFIMAAYKELRGVSGEGQRDGLNLQKLGDLNICIPNLSEQENISFFIETSSKKIHEAISLKEREFEKLKEYKATLINSAVTGKIKVS
ncbi:MAG: restriction endonuclease subunit S [Saprospiraceae bacterium]